MQGFETSATGGLNADLGSFFPQRGHNGARELSIGPIDNNDIIVIKEMLNVERRGEEEEQEEEEGVAEEEEEAEARRTGGVGGCRCERTGRSGVTE
ncbi:hypothetical protein EYF80_026580 [Liparis tanakae]|uniref:Uncharacterized protein n=1 Tax=Liparis tanakae TaxID=230148 RepID=A0A4Z2HBH1_9TELE|nr:hypothetical protein EYF80_026580 [Liparis tanakae]